ncbi:hypothetical protein [Desulfotomaculum sp. 1211_IL3151]|uniref:hypothetical protein n=1 Tax=Desulfotomaculum sp. 1211_IL3151 TaxID=3084055 RepID=UPI002FD94069
MVRLFRAWSVVDHYRGQDRVKFDWFAVGRQIPVGSYEELIENYDEQDQEAWCDQLLLNELFTEAEIGKLKGYLLNNHQLEVQVAEVSLPIKSGGLSHGLQLINGVNGFYSLADEAGYNLDLSILGHFEVAEEALSKALTEEEVQRGFEFVKLIFQELDLPWPEQKDIASLLNKIYKKSGYYIHQKNI